ncbi:hypothetical protein CMI37_16975 [Candidatus Pacearchaeota archaeon]|nr:hypothetical protein [Candidatus Pacearchaeota archaeon]
METKQLDFSEDTDDEWMQVVGKLRERQRVMNLELSGKEQEEFDPDEGASASEKMKCLQTWGVPERILKNIFSVENPLEKTKAVKWVRQFSLQPREAWCLVLSGGKGTGKSTGAAVWLYDNVPPDGAPSYTTRYWWSGTRIARTNGYAKEFEKMMQHKFMVIDDLGVEYLDKNGNFLQRLDELIDERYSNFKRTIITTNLNVQAFQDRYGDRVTDRLREGFAYGGGFYEIADDSMRARR